MTTIEDIRDGEAGRTVLAKVRHTTEDLIYKVIVSDVDTRDRSAENVWISLADFEDLLKKAQGSRYFDVIDWRIFDQDALIIGETDWETAEWCPDIECFETSRFEWDIIAEVPEAPPGVPVEFTVSWLGVDQTTDSLTALQSIALALSAQRIEYNITSKLKG